jgi:nicotinamide riboside transporter PnuC
MVVRSADPHKRLDFLRHLAWAISGTAVLAFIFVAALGGISPGDAEFVTVAVCVLAVIWSVHKWRELWAEERRAR